MQEFGLAQQFGKPAPFVGFDNYVTLATDPELWAVVAPLARVLHHHRRRHRSRSASLLALLMTAVGRVVRLILQVALLLAWAMPVVAAMTVWIWLFDRRRGVINYLLDMIPGVDMNRFDWLADARSPSSSSRASSSSGCRVPFVAFSVYAGLTQVSDEVLEAAAARRRERLAALLAASSAR